LARRPDIPIEAAIDAATVTLIMRRGGKDRHL
jgi:hypothetical protein